MKVIVNVSGFYGGDWKEAGPQEVEMNDKIAKQFLSPRGHQLSDAAAKPRQKQKTLTPPAKDD